MSGGAAHCPGVEQGAGALDDRWQGWMLLGLYAAGFAHWVFFFSNPHGPGLSVCAGGDWALASNYYDIIRESVRTGQIPWVMDFAHYSNRFLGLPETPLSPQYLLTLLFSDPVFNVVNLVVLYSCCFAGLVALRREYRLSPLPFAFLFLVYNFNGYLVSRAGVGHFMWFGYFFMPFAHLFLLRLIREPEGERHGIALAWMLALMLLQGSFHLFVWWAMFLCILVVLHPPLWIALGRVLMLSLGLGLFRFAPGAVSLWDTKLAFVTGYPDVPAFLDALTVVRNVDWLEELSRFRSLHWYEFDCYVGLSGLLLLGYFGVVRADRKNPALRVLCFASLVMVVLCFGKILETLGTLPIPLVSSQRIASRLVVLPLTTCAVLAAIRMEQWLRARPRGYAQRSLLALLVLSLAHDLYQHSAAWRVTRTDEWRDGLGLYPPEAHLLPVADWTDAGMRWYALSTAGGLLISVAVLGWSVIRWRMKRIVML